VLGSDGWRGGENGFEIGFAGEAAEAVLLGLGEGGGEGGVRLLPDVDGGAVEAGGLGGGGDGDSGGESGDDFQLHGREGSRL